MCLFLRDESTGYGDMSIPSSHLRDAFIFPEKIDFLLVPMPPSLNQLSKEGVIDVVHLSPLFGGSKEAESGQCLQIC